MSKSVLVFGSDKRSKSRTQVHHKDACNVNAIVRRAKSTGVLPPALDFRRARYGDFTDVNDFQTACDRVIDAQNAFARLPAKIRKRFNNDPKQLLSFVNDDNNLQEAFKLGS